MSEKEKQKPKTIPTKPDDGGRKDHSRTPPGQFNPSKPGPKPSPNKK